MTNITNEEEKTNNDYLVVAYKAHTTDNWYGVLVETHDFRLECGRRQKMWICTKNTQGETRETMDQRMQVTIREIVLAEHRQKKGAFTALVKHLLCTYGAVQLEAVQPQWLKKRLEESPFWIRQTPAEFKHFSPIYARVANAKDTQDIPFTLF